MDWHPTGRVDTTMEVKMSSEEVATRRACVNESLNCEGLWGPWRPVGQFLRGFSAEHLLTGWRVRLFVPGLDRPSPGAPSFAMTALVDRGGHGEVARVSGDAWLAVRAELARMIRIGVSDTSASIVSSSHVWLDLGVLDAPDGVQS